MTNTLKTLGVLVDPEKGCLGGRLWTGSIEIRVPIDQSGLPQLSPMGERGHDETAQVYEHDN